MPSTSAYTAATVFSASLRGARNSLLLRNVGSGSALRSSLPLVFSGKASSTVTDAGTMYAGSDRPANSARSAGTRVRPGAGTTYATNWSPVAVETTRTTVCDTSSCASRTVSISPSSIR